MCICRQWAKIQPCQYSLPFIHNIHGDLELMDNNNNNTINNINNINNNNNSLVNPSFSSFVLWVSPWLMCASFSSHLIPPLLPHAHSSSTINIININNNNNLINKLINNNNNNPWYFSSPALNARSMCAAAMDTLSLFSSFLHVSLFLVLLFLLILIILMILLSQISQIIHIIQIIQII